jgi:hypothetical protein
MRSLALFLAVALALATSGCIANMADLKDRIGGDEAVEPAAVVDTPTAPTTPVENTTKALKAPVARITVFGGNGALVYKATFQADDAAELVFVDAKSKLSLIAGESEALEPGATLTGFAWTLAGKPVEGGRQASAEVGEAGLYPLTLTVTDSNGQKDTQNVTLAVAPEAYDVVIELLSGPIAGAEGAPLAESLAFTLAADESKGTSIVQKVVIVAAPDPGLDAAIEVLDAEGTSVGTADNAGHTDLDQTETIELGGIALGDYTVSISPFAGADPDGVPVTITVTYMPIIAGLNDSGDAHGGHAGH